MLQKITLFTLAAFLLIGCTKRTLILDDNMWKRLSSGTGIWVVKKQESFFIDSNGNEEQYYIDESENTKYYFYSKLDIVAGSYVNNNYLSIVTYIDSLDLFAFSGNYLISNLGPGLENVRISLPGQDWVVEKGGRQKQTWTLGGIADKTVLELKKCNSCKPDFIGNGATEQGG